MTPKLTYLGPSDPIPFERHVAVIVHRDNMGMEKGYFYDSAGENWGGSGSFDWRMPEAIERAEKFAAERQIPLIVVRVKREGD